MPSNTTIPTARSDNAIAVFDGKNVAELSSWSVTIDEQGADAELEVHGFPTEACFETGMVEYVHIDDGDRRYELRGCYTSSVSANPEESMDMTIEAIRCSIHEKV